MTRANDTETRYLEKRLTEIRAGVRAAIDREVAELRRRGLPIYVAENGHVVDASKPRDP